MAFNFCSISFVLCALNASHEKNLIIHILEFNTKAAESHTVLAIKLMSWAHQLLSYINGKVQYITELSGTERDKQKLMQCEYVDDNNRHFLFIYF